MYVHMYICGIIKHEVSNASDLSAVQLIHQRPSAANFEVLLRTVFGHPFHRPQMVLVVLVSQILVVSSMATTALRFHEPVSAQSPHTPFIKAFVHRVDAIVSSFRKYNDVIVTQGAVIFLLNIKSSLN